MGYYVKLVVGLALFIGGLVAFEVALANLLEVGTCASGNTPYAIAQPCPEGTGKWAAMLPAGIIGGLIGAGIYYFRGDRPGGDLFDPPIGFGTVAWALLFVGTGLVCLYVRFFADVELQAGAEFATIFIACLFIPMGLAPIVFGIWSGRDERDSAERIASNPNFSGTDKIARLDRLRRSGALTNSEFEQEKAKILAGG